jgi:hypothetical protein
MPGRRSDPRKRAEIAERNAQIVALKNEGLTFREIAARMSIPVATAHRGFNEALERIIEPEAARYRAEQAVRLAGMREVVMEVLAAKHVTVQNGRVVREITGHDSAGKPVYGPAIEDDGPVLAAVDRLLKIEEAERKLLGLDVKPEVEVSGTLRYVITGVPGIGDGDGANG